MIAFSGQLSSHFLQPIQAFLQFVRATAPFSRLLQATATVLICGIISIIPLGQFLAQSPQPIHFLAFMRATPSITQIASLKDGLRRTCRVEDEEA